MPYSLLLPVLLILLGSCSYPPIAVQTEYITVEHLASYWVKTPDPRLQNPPTGQRLIVNWSLPEWRDNCQLYLKVRYRNHREEEFRVALPKKSGVYLLDVLNACYIETGGLLTYKIEIQCDGVVIHEWKHQLWTELIEFPIAPSSELHTNQKF